MFDCVWAVSLFVFDTNMAYNVGLTYCSSSESAFHENSAIAITKDCFRSESVWHTAWSSLDGYHSLQLQSLFAR